MDGCPISFLASPLLRRKPIVIEAIWFADAGRVLVSLGFDLPMDQTVTPENNVWELIIDGTPTAIELQEWDTPTRLDLRTALATTGVNPMTIELLLESEGLHSATGQNVLPFDPMTVVED